MSRPPDARGCWWIAGALALLALLIKVPTLSTPLYWDEMAWTEQALWLSRGNLFRAIPGLRPAATFWGHPPGLHVAMAAIWKVVGYSIPSAHLFIAAFSAVGVASVFVLGRWIADVRTGLLAALCTLVAPVYVAQSGMFLADLPLAALAPLMVYLGLRDRYAAYVVCSCAMVLIKETAIGLVVAFLAFELLRHGPGSADTWRRIVRLSVPLWVIGAFFLLQKLTTGHFFAIYDFEVPLVRLDLDTIASKALLITRFVFVDQHRFLVILLVVAALVVDRRARRRDELVLLVLVMITFGYVFSAILILKRYLLPVLPFLYLLGARSLRSLIPWPRLHAAAAVLLVLALAWPLRFDPFWGNGEFNLTYLDVVRVNQDIARFVEREFPGATVAAPWPQLRFLRIPELGYVTSPVRVVNFPGPIDDATLVFVSVPWDGTPSTLRRMAQADGWHLLRRSQAGDAIAELYGRPGTQR